MLDKGRDSGAVTVVRSPDELNKAIQVTSPGAWMVLAACFALLAGILAWAFFGTVSTGVQAIGVIRDGKLITLLNDDEVGEVHVGKTAVVDGITMTVEKIADIPLSRSEALEFMGNEYMVSRNMEGDWGWPTVLIPEDPAAFSDGTILEINIEAEHISPISQLFGGSKR